MGFINLRIFSPCSDLISSGCLWSTSTQIVVSKSYNVEMQNVLWPGKIIYFSLLWSGKKVSFLRKKVRESQGIIFL